MLAEVSTKLMLATRAQREIARRAAPIASVPILKFGPGEASELDKAIAIFLLGHLIWCFPGRDTGNSKASSVSDLAGKTVRDTIAKVTVMAARRRIGGSKNRASRFVPAGGH